MEDGVNETDTLVGLEKGVRSGGSTARPRFAWWTRLWLIDWLLLGSLFGLAALLGSHSVGIEPYQRFQPANDTMTAYPLLPDIVPSWLCAVMAVAIPLCVVGLVQLVPWRTWVRSHDVHNAALALLSALCHAFVFTGIFKLYAGRLRPDYQARVAANVDVLDGMQSFPSGHSSSIFASMSLLSIYLACKLGVFHESGGHAHRFLASFWPLVIGGFVAVSRTRDYHHNFSDILAGSVIGLVAGPLSYFSYFTVSGKAKSRVSKW
jgi:diacylglycerol diphosphate phosphatase/phosphatidate phosphatase